MTSELTLVRSRSRRKIRLLRTGLRLLYRAIARLDVSGLEHIPAQGPCLMVFNHLSNFDAHLLFCVLERDDLTGLFAANYRAHPFFRFMVEAPGGLWLRRGEGDRRALETALSLLEQGWMIGLAPEGRRSPHAALIHAKRGAAFLASKADVPVLPVGITGTENAASGIRRLHRVDVSVRIGAPFKLPPRPTADSRHYMQHTTDLIMRRVAALLPAAYRGVYAANSGPTQSYAATKED